jgi:hypothetical protein
MDNGCGRQVARVVTCSAGGCINGACSPGPSTAPDPSTGCVSAQVLTRSSDRLARMAPRVASNLRGCWPMMHSVPTRWPLLEMSGAIT